MPAVVALAGCSSDDTHTVVMGSMPAPIPADEDWRDDKGGSTLDSMLQEANLDGVPTVVILPIQTVGCDDCDEIHELIASYERPDQVQSDLVGEIRDLEIDGLRPDFLGLSGTRDGYRVQVQATTPDGDPGIMFTVLVVPDDLKG